MTALTLMGSFKRADSKEFVLYSPSQFAIVARERARIVTCRKTLTLTLSKSERE